MTDRLRIAVFGRGFVGRVHVENFRRLDDVDVSAIPSAEYRKSLDDPNIDAVDICTINAQHYTMAKDALEAGKHVICEKPLATSAEDARKLVKLADETKLRNCTCHNLRYYPLVQHMRRMREEGEFGEILVVQGTYSQDWLLYDTDWNWRIESKDNGPSRAMADIGSHFCDMAEHVTGLRITALCADLQTFHKTRKKPKGAVETFSGKTLRPEDYIEVPIETEDFGAVLFRMGNRTRGAFTASQLSAGRKNGLNIEIYGTKQSAAWNGERPDELWLGSRNEPNRIVIKDPSLLKPGARSYADLPGGHAEGYGDTFKQVFRRFCDAVRNPSAPIEYPQFSDGLRQLELIEAELLSSKQHGWVEVT